MASERMARGGSRPAARPSRASLLADRHILHAPGDEIRHAFLLTGGLVSLEYAGVDGDTVELAIVGRDGMVGIPLVLHDLAVPYRAVVRARSMALRARATVLQAEWEASREVHDVLLAYAGRVLNQVSQAALCRQGHTALQRLCRWLLADEARLFLLPAEPSATDWDRLRARFEEVYSERSPLRKALVALESLDDSRDVSHSAAIEPGRSPASPIHQAPANAQKPAERSVSQVFGI